MFARGSEAKTKVGEHHRTVEEAFSALESFYGNPKVLFNELKKELKDKVSTGNFAKDWSFHGSQQRVDAILHVSEFLREAEKLGKEYKELENDVFSQIFNSIVQWSKGCVNFFIGFGYFLYTVDGGFSTQIGDY